MQPTYLIAGLALVTILLVIGFALNSKRQVEKLRQDDDHTPSSLAKDG